MKNGIILLLLTLLILPIYFNTLHASWQFDDKPNILANKRLHIDTLTPDALWNTFFAKLGRPSFYRPLPNLSFALNWYFGRDNPFGYHLFNIVLHILCAYILYHSVRLLFRTPRLKDLYMSEDIQFIALLSAALWAINPIQVQAVTYIVQRMAAMAAMFYLLGIYVYLRGRLSDGRAHQILFGLGTLCCFAFAWMSKENAVVFPLTIILMEIIFFPDLSIAFKRIKEHVWLLSATAAGLALVGVIAFFSVNIRHLIGYGGRPFTLVERLLTEPRIVLFYVSQIFYPIPSRLSITHDVVLSKSLWSPWTTLPAILTILIVIGFAVSQIRKRPLLAFAVLFFFLNHVVESTVIALELIFEHRNYLPSLFLFLPIAAGIKYLLNLYNKSNRFLFIFISVFVILIMVGWGSFTYLRNQAWQTESSLWQDAMKKAPRDARPACNLAIQLAWHEKPSSIQYDVALALFEKSLGLFKARTFLDQDILNNMGSIYFQKGEYATANRYFKQALQMNPSYLKAHYNLASSLIMTGAWEEASRHADFLINNPKNYRKSEYYDLKGFILLWRQHPREALSFFRAALKKDPQNQSALLNMGVAMSLLGKSRNAAVFLNRAIQLTPGDIRPFFALIENSLRAGDTQRAEKHTQRLFKTFHLNKIRNGLNAFSDNYRTAPLADDLIRPHIQKQLVRITAEILAAPPKKKIK